MEKKKPDIFDVIEELAKQADDCRKSIAIVYDCLNWLLKYMQTAIKQNNLIISKEVELKIEELKRSLENIPIKMSDN